MIVLLNTFIIFKVEALNNFFKLKKNTNYQFSSGILDKYIFELLELNKNKIKILIGNIKTTISNKNYLFKPI